MNICIPISCLWHRLHHNHHPFIQLQWVCCMLIKYLYIVVPVLQLILMNICIPLFCVFDTDLITIIINSSISSSNCSEFVVCCEYICILNVSVLQLSLMNICISLLSLTQTPSQSPSVHPSLTPTAVSLLYVDNISVYWISRFYSFLGWIFAFHSFMSLTQTPSQSLPTFAAFHQAISRTTDGCTNQATITAVWGFNLHLAK